ncbi:MAG: LrgB family protein [Gammaproteobacteria bacterium]|jgi:predicted murein hydrolase (TIGR00659 family)
MKLDLALGDIWVYLATSPLLHLTLTVLAYVAGDWIFRRSGQKAIFNPVLLSILMLVTLLSVTGTDYRTYFEGAQFVHFMLGPATVALAIPLYRHLRLIRQLLLPILASIILGATVSVSSAVFLAQWLGASQQTLISLAPKSVTAPVAMGITEKVGGLPSLTAALVVLTGVLGAVIGAGVLAVVRVRDDRARGLALGLNSHGIGTARAFQISDLAGAFSALAMGLMALTSAFALPFVLRWAFG